MLNGKLEYFNSGELIKPLIASSALPPIFSPVEINNNLYSDGGVLNNFPVEPLKNSCDTIIGSFVNPITEIDKSEINSSLKLLYRVYHLGLDASNIKKFDQCNYVFLPKNLQKISVLDTKSIKKAYEIGYKQVQINIEKLRDTIPKLS